MTREDAKALKSFDQHCNCGGYAWRLTGRLESQPHMIWCPQMKQYGEWYMALHTGVDDEK